MRRNAFVLTASLLPSLTVFGCAPKTASMEPAGFGDPMAYPSMTDAGSMGSTAVTDPYPAYGSPVVPASMDTSYDAPTAAGGGQTHTVVRRDTLFSLARAYYGDASRWKDIYEANRATISDPNKIRVGQRLVIP